MGECCQAIAMEQRAVGEVERLQGAGSGQRGEACDVGDERVQRLAPSAPSSIRRAWWARDSTRSTGKHATCATASSMPWHPSSDRRVRAVHCNRHDACCRWALPDRSSRCRDGSARSTPSSEASLNCLHMVIARHNAPRRHTCSWPCAERSAGSKGQRAHGPAWHRPPP